MKPDEALAHQGLSKAQTALRQAQRQQQRPGSRRMVVQETDDSEEGEDDEGTKQESTILHQQEKQQDQKQTNATAVSNGNDGAAHGADISGEAVAGYCLNGLASHVEVQRGNGPIAAAAIDDEDALLGTSACSSNDSTQTELSDMSSSDDEQVNEALMSGTMVAVEPMPSFDAQTDHLKAAGNDAFTSGVCEDCWQQLL
jgi:hypothetical protein